MDVLRRSRMWRKLLRCRILAIILVFALSQLPLYSTLALSTDLCDAGPYYPDIGFSPDGEYVFAGWSREIPKQDPQFEFVVWESKTGKVTRSYSVKSTDAAAFSLDGKYFGLNDYHQGHLKIFDFNSGKEIFFVETNRQTQYLRFLNNSKWLLSIQFGETNLWDIGTGKVIHSFRTATGDRIVSHDLSSDGRYFLAVSVEGYDYPLVLWNVETGAKLKTFSGYDGVFSPDGRQIAFIRDQHLVIWDMSIETERSVKFPEDPNDNVLERTIETLSPDGKYIAITVDVWDRVAGLVLYRGIEVWDVQAGKRLWAFGSRESAAVHEFFPDDEHVLIINTFGFESWNLLTQQREGAYSIADEWNAAPDGIFEISPDGNYLLSYITASHGDPDDADNFRHHVNLWNIKTGTRIRQFCVPQ
jgi:WD40 repeat protein